MSNSPVKYRHPENSELDWSGKGRQPKWVEAYLANGGSMVSLDVTLQDRDPPVLAVGAIDLGIGDRSVEAEPTLAERLYGNRIATGLATLPEEGDPSFTPGVRQAVASETANMNSRLADLAERTNSLPVAEQPEADQPQLEVCLHEFGMIGMTAEEFIKAGVEELNQATVKMCRAGVAFWAAQEALKIDSGHAESGDSESTAHVRSRSFKEWITDAGLSERRVYEAVGLAKFYSRLPDAMRSKALSIGKKNALLLASLSQEVIDQAAESGNDLIGKADMMTVAELKAEIKALQRREKNYEAELERSSSQIKRLSEAKKRTTDFLLRTEELREECMALQLGAELHLNSLKRLFEETDVQGPEGNLQIEHLWVVANTLAARSLDLLEFMRAGTPQILPDRPQSRHLLTPDEAVRWLQDYPLIENRFAAEAAVRESRRDMTRPRGPGRPAGSRNKGEEA